MSRQCYDPDVTNLSIDRLPRFPLATLPTPLEEATRLRAALGGPSRSPRILIKRDDLTGLALGGNKARKLEFIVGHALQEGATRLVTTGAVQSNHARMTAAAARRAGLEVTLVLTARATHPEFQGNLLLDRIFGADIHFIPAGPDPTLAVAPDEAERVEEVLAELRGRGERPYYVPVGGSTPLGALGYALATRELAGQLAERHESPTRLYFASGSRGTHAGLALGRSMFAPRYRLRGIAVSGGEEEKVLRATRIVREAAALVGFAGEVLEADLRTDQDFIGEGYGIPSAECLDAIRLAARTEGLLLDPVYTGKAMAALVDHVQRGTIEPSETIVFLHTGGGAGLFAYADAFAPEKT